MTLSDVIPDAELQLFHPLVHLIGEHLLLAAVEYDHHLKTQMLVWLLNRKIIYHWSSKIAQCQHTYK